MKTITPDQIKAAAQALDVPVAALKAVMEVECRGSGFNADGTPVILFERHIFYRQLLSSGLSGLAKRAVKERPDLCNPVMGGYGPASSQHGRLAAATLYDRACALESASWGLGQVMGYHWRSLGYPTLQHFVNAMYRSEADQLDALCQFIRYNGLTDALRNGRWALFASRYNGPAYRKNRYDEKLEAAFKKWGGGVV